MSEKDDFVDKLLESAGFRQVRGEGQDPHDEFSGMTVRLVKEAEEFDALEVAEFFLGERDIESNLFRGALPERPEIELLVLRAIAKEASRQIFFFDDPKQRDRVSFGVYDTAGPEDAIFEYGIVARHSYVTLSREDILGVYFEIIEVRKGAETLTTRSIGIESAQGYFLYLDDSGYVYLEPFEDDDEEEQDETS
ncbi:MAG: hypothetical protein HYS15_03005 [Candidatus Spechtbacteria bacterium]|nr:hypothetical protein [Candidatus Spechtbacteria bacterium]